MAAGLASPSGRHNEQGNNQDKPCGQAHQGDDIDDRPEALSKVFALHTAPGANDDGEKGEKTQPHGAGDNGGEDFFTPGWWRRFEG